MTMPAFLSITTRLQGSTWDAVGWVNSAPLHSVVNDALPVWWTMSDFSVTPFGRSAAFNVVTRFAGLVAEKMGPGADVCDALPEASGHRAEVASSRRC